MKKKTLFLKKEVIADLSSQEMTQLVGGYPKDPKETAICDKREDFKKLPDPTFVIPEDKSQFGCTETYVGRCPDSGAHFGCPSI